MSQIQVKLEELNALPATKIVENQNVEAKFIQMYNDIWGTRTGTQIYHKEVFNFQKVLRENPALAECSKMSLFGCFLDMAVNGLSLDPTGKPHCYLIPRKHKCKCKNRKSEQCKTIALDDGSKVSCQYYNSCTLKDGESEYYENRATISITGYGELTMRMRAGQIKYADNPVIVYEGDTFQIDLDRGVKKITYSANTQRKSTKIQAAFIRIVRADGSEDYQWLLEPDIHRLAKYSAKNNSFWKNGQFIQGEANKLYTSNGGQIDPGFLENKMIKHAFDAYPKVRIGKFTQMESIEEPEPEIDYGVVDADAEEIKPTGFGEEENTPSAPTADPGVTVPVSDEDNDSGF